MNDDDRALARYGDELVRAVESSLATGSNRACIRTATSRSLHRRQTASWNQRVVSMGPEDVVAELRASSRSTSTKQRKNPLAILRVAVRYPTRVLRAPEQSRSNATSSTSVGVPDDEFALTPVAFADFGPAVHDAGIVWGGGEGTRPSPATERAQNMRPVDRVCSDLMDRSRIRPHGPMPCSSLRSTSCHERALRPWCSSICVGPECSRPSRRSRRRLVGFASHTSTKCCPSPRARRVVPKCFRAAGFFRV